MTIHIGKKIKFELYKQDIPITTFAKQINRSRNVIYDIFERESIDTALLNKICLTLRLDFFSLYSNQKDYKKEVIPLQKVSDEGEAKYFIKVEELNAEIKKNEQLSSEIEYLKRIIELMEERENGRKG
jgi:hypothetical protein